MNSTLKVFATVFFSHCSNRRMLKRKQKLNKCIVIVEPFFFSLADSQMFECSERKLKSRQLCWCKNHWKRQPNNVESSKRKKKYWKLEQCHMHFIRSHLSHNIRFFLLCAFAFFVWIVNEIWNKENICLNMRKKEICYTFTI